jgi:beta-xylosidase
VSRFALLALLVLAACGCGGGSGDGAGGEATFRNPVHDSDFPDPFVLTVGDTYYAYATNGTGKQVQTLTSTDLVHWKPGPDALPQVGKWAYPGKTWAPEVLARDDGTYVLYYTANGGSQCVGRAVAKAPQGPFVDRWPQPLVCQRLEGGSIDPSPFRDDDGSLYLTWKNDGNSLGQPTNIYVQRLSGDGTTLVGKPKRIETNDAGWEASVVEGSMLWKHDGTYFLFYSGGDYTSDDYAVGYARCETPLGACTDAAENPILKSTCRASGPGHNALVAVDGQTWIVYHAWRPDHAGDKRMLWIDRLDWKGGKPVVEGPTCSAQPAP